MRRGLAFARDVLLAFVSAPFGTGPVPGLAVLVGVVAILLGNFFVYTFAFALAVGLLHGGRMGYMRGMNDAEEIHRNVIVKHVEAWEDDASGRLAPDHPERIAAAKLKADLRAKRL